MGVTRHSPCESRESDLEFHTHQESPPQKTVASVILISEGKYTRKFHMEVLVQQEPPPIVQVPRGHND